MATYNGAEFINQQIDSVIGQLSANDELIISDDGSTDHTLKIIASYSDSRIKVFSNERNKGPVGNFENAIRHAAGDILFLCDQDDIWFSNKIEKHVKLHDLFDLVISDAVVVNELKQVLFKSFFKARGSKQGLLANLKRNSYIGCCMSFNRKIAEKAIPFPVNVHMHDWWIGLVAEITGRIYFLEETLMFYVRHTNNVSSTLIQTLPFKTQLYNRWILMSQLVTFYKNAKRSN